MKTVIGIGSALVVLVTALWAAQAISANAVVPAGNRIAAMPCPTTCRNHNPVRFQQEFKQPQAQMDAAAQPLARVSRQLDGTMTGAMSPRQGSGLDAVVLGIRVVGRTSLHRHAGVVPQAVTHGGPTEKAGLRAEDGITAIDRTALKPRGDTTPAGEVIEYMAHIKPGNALNLTFLRGTRAHTPQVIAGRLPDYLHSFYPSTVPRVLPVNLRAIYGPPLAGFYWFWGGLSLVALTPDLGQYFGTDKGLLVVHAPRNPAVKLEDGDVILKVGSRALVTPPEAMRILGAYRPGATVTFRILRKGQPMIVRITLPKIPRPRLGPNHPMTLGG